MTAAPAGHPLVALLLQSQATPEFFRRYLTDAVASRRISRKGLGEEIGISRQAVADFLGGREPTGETLRKMRGWLVLDALEREDDGPAEAYMVAAGISCATAAGTMPRRRCPRCLRWSSGRRNARASACRNGSRRCGARRESGSPRGDAG